MPKHRSTSQTKKQAATLKVPAPLTDFPDEPASKSDYRRYMLRYTKSGNYFTFFRYYLAVMSSDAAIVAQSLLNLGKSKSKKGWILCTGKFLTKHLFMSRWVQNRVFNELKKAGFIDVVREGLPARRYIRVRVVAIHKAIDRYFVDGDDNKNPSCHESAQLDYSPNPSCHESAQLDGMNSHTTKDKSDSQEESDKKRYSRSSLRDSATVCFSSDSSVTESHPGTGTFTDSAASPPGPGTALSDNSNSTAQESPVEPMIPPLQTKLDRPTAQSVEEIDVVRAKQLQQAVQAHHAAVGVAVPRHTITTWAKTFHAARRLSECPKVFQAVLDYHCRMLVENHQYHARAYCPTTFKRRFAVIHAQWLRFGKQSEQPITISPEAARIAQDAKNHPWPVKALPQIENAVERSLGAVNGFLSKIQVWLENADVELDGNPLTMWVVGGKDKRMYGFVKHIRDHIHSATSYVPMWFRNLRDKLKNYPDWDGDLVAKWAWREDHPDFVKEMVRESESRCGSRRDWDELVLIIGTEKSK